MLPASALLRRRHCMLIHIIRSELGHLLEQEVLHVSFGTLWQLGLCHIWLVYLGQVKSLRDLLLSMMAELSNSVLQGTAVTFLSMGDTEVFYDLKK